ncbi:MAG: hypothetical protein HY785_29535 [Oscillatoriophycideae cyanobacterium NC_groundwater_1537_Pr4_S-0.65um_50_18]|nr:hypothetical protein [Oscillatoriophycideae cyanobacterium NC_groundwater_1537_Pr4_S-0.65um_50_18]
MASQNPITLKSVVGIVTLLGAITGLITAIVGPEGFPKLVATLRDQGSEPIQTPTLTVKPSGSHNVEAMGNGNIAIGGSNSSVGSIQQSGDGNCNNIQASGQSVTIICTPASSGTSFPGSGLENFPFGMPSGNQASASPVKLQASVEGLQRESDRFTLWLVNATPDQSVEIQTKQLTLSDDQGNTYELDPWTGHSMGLNKVVPPNGRIKLEYTLTSPIAPGAATVTFTLDNVWTQPTGSQFKAPLPSVQWTTPL